jgi:hypothetical protein
MLDGTLFLAKFWLVVGIMAGAIGNPEEVVEIVTEDEAELFTTHRDRLCSTKLVKDTWATVLSSDPR